MLLKVTRYPVSHPLLRNLINYFWVMESESSISINHKLLPVSNMDFIFNFSSPIEYITDKQIKTAAARFHLSGIREKYCVIKQTGNLRVFGASFFHIGLFPVLKMPLNEFTGNTIDLDDIINNFTEDVLEKVSLEESNTEIIKVIEKAIVDSVDMSLIPSKDVYELTKVFCADPICINDLCRQYGINQRKLERVFNKYIGVSPKLFQRIKRFQRIVNQLQRMKGENLVSFAYDNNYFDQTHFIKDFKSFTGSTPTEFLGRSSSIKQIMELY